MVSDSNVFGFYTFAHNKISHNFGTFEGEQPVFLNRSNGVSVTADNDIC
jgi:hypothetical protein